MLEFKGLATLRILDHQIGAHDICGHEIGSELDAIEGQIQRPTQRPHQQGLTQSGDPFEQDMATGKDGHQGAIDDGFMPHDDLADLSLEFLVGITELLNVGFYAHGFFGR